MPVALLLACALILTACGGKEKEKAASTPAATETAEPAQAAGCEKVAKPKPANQAKLPKPTPGGSFASLVSKRFYDGLSFHRIVAGFVIQGGDPKGDGTGGPGYSVTETPPKDLVYTKGIVAMAKTQTEAAGTSGSQFFVVTGEELDLPPEYALLGKITKGQEVVDKIGVLAVNANEQPTQPVVIRQIRITVS
jgi:cyclophilin family peptidyl-prolyl cis-trans isomerase